MIETSTKKIVIPDLVEKEYVYAAHVMILNKFDGIETNVNMYDYNNDKKHIMFCASGTFITHIPKTWLVEVNYEKTI